mgnify:CR=1 FL=1
MEARACRSCGKLFNYIGGQPICEACKKRKEEQFLAVKEYLWEHKNASFEEIAEATEVSVKQLKQWVREERLSFSDDSPIIFRCERCGKDIKTGRFCSDCKTKMGNKLDALYEKPGSGESFDNPGKPGGSGMRFV